MGKKVLCFAIFLLAISTVAQAEYSCTKMQSLVGTWSVTMDNATTYKWVIAPKDAIVSGLTCAQAVIGEGYRNPETDNVPFIIAWASFLQDPTKSEFQYLETEHQDVYDMNWLNSHAAGFTAFIASDNSSGVFHSFTKTGNGPAQFVNGVRVCTDSDGDGYYIELGCSTLPQDCNDNDPNENLKCECTDLDQDGYFIGDNCTKPKKDCDDSNVAIFDNLTGYVDADSDGFTVGGPVTVCTNGSLPTGYRKSPTYVDDCDDTNPLITNICSTCDVTVIPKKFSTLLGIISPIQWFMIIGPSGTDFTQPINIDYGTDAVFEILKLKLSSRLIFGLVRVRPFKLESGDYDLTLSYGDNICTGSITVK